MTVGISLTNGLEAVVITDGRVSGMGGRQSDSADKMGLFVKDNYVGVISGSGVSNLVNEINKNVNRIQGENLDEFVYGIQQKHKSSVDKFKDGYLQYEKEEIERRSNIYANEEDQRGFKQNETVRRLNKYEEHTNDNRAEFLLTAFDREAERIRVFYVNSELVSEWHLDHIENGSGSDGANLYLATKLQGIDPSKLSFSDIAFFAMNAYSLSTVNMGVGGTPKIAKVSKDEDKEGAKVIDLEKTTILGNLSGAYLSEFNPELTAERTRDFFKTIMDENQEPDYETIAGMLDLNVGVLTTTYIPLSSWQDRSNRQHFKPADHHSIRIYEENR